MVVQPWLALLPRLAHTSLPDKSFRASSDLTMKLLALIPASALLAAPAMAGPFYANIEANSGFYGGDYSGTATDFHIGVEGSAGAASWYLQGGPTLISPDGGASETKATGKVGGSIAATEKLSVYGEISAAFDDVNSYGTKAGLKYKF